MPKASSTFSILCKYHHPLANVYILFTIVPYFAHERIKIYSICVIVCGAEPKQKMHRYFSPRMLYNEPYIPNHKGELRVISLLLVRKIIQLFLIMILGYLLVKLKVLKSEESVVLSKISLYLVMPAVILTAFQVDFKPEIQEGLLLAFVAAVAIHILLLLIGHGSGKLFKFEEIDVASIIYSNAGNLIIPIVTAVLGNEWVIYSTAFVSVQLIFLWTHCKLMFSKEKTPNIRKIILNVNMIAIFVGVLSMLSGIRLPAMLNETMGSVGAMIGPLGMLITGMIVAGMDLKQIFTSKKVYVITFYRMILCPAIILLLLKLSNAGSLVDNGVEILLITFLATVTPAASTVTQFAQVHNKDAEYAGAINIMTTLVCIVTMPIFVILYFL